MSAGKVGLDDFIASGHDVEDLLNLATDALPDPPEDASDENAEYFATADGTFRRKELTEGTVIVQLTNFRAEIVGDIREDDGIEERRLFEIEASLGSRSVTFRIPWMYFPTLNWAAEHLGARALVFPGMTTRDHAQFAIRLLSTEPLERTIYSHLGWRNRNGAWIYLHAAGAITSEGNLTEVSVAPPESLSNYVLPAPPTGDRRIAAIRSSMKLLEVGPRRLTLPIYSSIFRALLGNTDHSVHASGETGTFKTAVATLAQQHFGAGLDVDHLPGSWSSTGNALEVLAFAGKDALFVIDDFVPRGGSQKVARLHKEADRILRAQGNHSGRQRLRPDASLRPVKAPRGLILSTGEDIPQGHSLRARMVIVEFNKGDIDKQKLTAAQADAASGLYAECLSSFLTWLAPRYAEVRKSLSTQLAALRSLAAREGMHARTPGVIASLSLGFKYFLEFAVDAGALTRDEADRQWNEGWKEFIQIGTAQRRYHDASEPTLRFRELLSAAIASGQAHIASIEGAAPQHPESWGWRRMEAAIPDAAPWLPGGSRVGWLEGADDLYLEPDAAYAAAQEMARRSGDAIAITGRTLHKRFADRRLLRSTEQTTRGTLTIRKIVQGERRPVLHVGAVSFLFDGPDQTDHEGGFDGLDDESSWSGPGSIPTKPDQQTDHDSSSKCSQTPPDLTSEPEIGQVGQILGTNKRRSQVSPRTQRFVL